MKTATYAILPSRISGIGCDAVQFTLEDVGFGPEVRTVPVVWLPLPGGIMLK